jgi:hypothetical protein
MKAIGQLAQRTPGSAFLMQVFSFALAKFHCPLLEQSLL